VPPFGLFFERGCPSSLKVIVDGQRPTVALASFGLGGAEEEKQEQF
jgi:hypothetical protein